MLILFTMAEEYGVDLKEFEKLYNKYKNLMFFVAIDILKDRGLAEDAVQMAFINIIKSFNKINLENCNETKKYFVVVVRRGSINLYNLRKKKGTVDIEEEYYNNIGDSKGEFAYDDIENEVQDALLLLPSKYADIMYLKYIIGYSNSEIAKQLNLKEGTVRQRVNRGKSKLKDILEEKGVDING